MIIAIDPGPTESAFVLMDGTRVINKAKVKNELLLDGLGSKHPGFERSPQDILVIEVIDASYGMSVGKEVFQTVFWSGRFAQTWGGRFRQMNRATIKTHLCGTARAKDKNVIAALTERFGGKGTKKDPGFFYGFSGDMWQAYAVGLTALETGVTMESTGRPING